MLIVTVPGPHNPDIIKMIVRHHNVDGCRFNTGVRVPFSPEETLERLLEQIGCLDFWLDIKGRQLRIIQWSDPEYGEILLNHEVKVDLPAEVYFRGDDVCQVRAILANQLFVYPNPKYALGAGQSLNIKGSNLTIEGYLTEEDILYLEAAKKLGINKLMLSFVESNEDIKTVEQYCPDAQMYLKIESQKGLDFVKLEYIPTDRIHLMAARDDLFINLEQKYNMIFALQNIIKKDPQAAVASRILTSLVRSEEINNGDIADLYMLHKTGYKNFMLSDSISSRPEIFYRAMDFWNEFEIKKQRG